MDIYRDIEARTGGEIYIGVVGPVRTGKSTFIKRFMELLVMPQITDEHQKAQTRDELPQSAAGKTIMTTEPKFIPKEAAKISLEDGIEARVRLIDCVGFMVNGAAGHEENGAERLVKTPWYEAEIPFTEAAEVGTRKVIRDHSTIGLAVTTDGSFGELLRNDYLESEQRTVNELKEIGKPFLVLLNSQRPLSEETKELAAKMEKAYGASVLPVNCEQLKKEDIEMILAQILKEFPVTEIDFSIPRWMEILPESHPFKAEAIRTARDILSNVSQMKDVNEAVKTPEGGNIEDVRITKMEMADGSVAAEIAMDDGCYYQVISEFAGMPVADDYTLIHTLSNLSGMQKEYEKVKNALSQVRL